jgi:tetratricopeptide (TPR) repeat protein
MRLRRARWTAIAWAGALMLVGSLLTLAVRWARQRDPDRLFLRADAAFRAGRYAEADAVLERLERLRPPSPVDRLLRAEVASALDRAEEALAEFAAIPDDHPLAPVARLRTGQVQIRRGLTRPAEAAFLASLRLLPRGVQPRKELVFVYNIQHRQAELDAVLTALLDLDGLDYQYVLHWTRTRNTVWNARGDLPSLEKFAAADPDDRWSRLALVEALRRLDRIDDAERALGALPISDPRVRTKRVLIAMDRGDFPSAESLLAAGPHDDPQLARLRGQLALRHRDGAAAEQHFRIALAADPIDHVALSGLATALELLGRTAEAGRYLHAARRHDDLWKLVARAATTEGEHDPKLPRQLGMACAAAGRNQEARAWLRLAISRDPLDSESQQTLFELEHGSAQRSLDGQHAGLAAPSAGNRATRQDTRKFRGRSPGFSCSGNPVLVRSEGVTPAICFFKESPCSPKPTALLYCPGLSIMSLVRGVWARRTLVQRLGDESYDVQSSFQHLRIARTGFLAPGGRMGHG